MLEPHWAPGCFQAGFLLLRAGLVSLVLIRKQRRRPNPSGTQPGVFSCGNTAENTHNNEKRCVCVCLCGSKCSCQHHLMMFDIDWYLYVCRTSFVVCCAVASGYWTFEWIFDTCEVLIGSHTVEAEPRVDSSKSVLFSPYWMSKSAMQPWRVL